MKRSTKKYAGGIAIILLLMAALILLFCRKYGSSATQEIYFSPQKISAVDRILILQENDSLLLERSDKKWMLNTGGAIARNDRVNLLLEFLARIEIVSPVAKKAEEHILELLHKKAKRVQLYIRGNLEMEFRIMYDSAVIQGTYMMPEESGNAFMVRLKGVAGDNIENIFELDYRSWQENILFDLGPDEIQKIDVEYPEAINESYIIFRNEDGDLELSGMSGTITENNTDMRELTDYLFFFRNIHFEYPEERISDSMVSALPFVELRLTSNTRVETDLKGYLLRSYGESSDINISHFIGVVRDGRDTVILDYQDLDPIFRRLEDFQKK